MMTYKCCCLDDIIRISWCRMRNSTCNDQQMRIAHTDVVIIIDFYCASSSPCVPVRSARSTHCKLAGKAPKGYLSCMQNPGAFSD